MNKIAKIAAGAFLSILLVAVLAAGLTSGPAPGPDRVQAQGQTNPKARALDGPTPVVRTFEVTDIGARTAIGGGAVTYRGD